MVKSQHLAGEGHAECHDQKKDADDPGKFSGKLVGPKEEDLHHMDEDDRNHEIRAPAVEGPNKPAKRNAMIQGLKAVPGFSCGRHIN